VPGQFDDISVLAVPGASKPAVQQRAIAAVLPAGVQVVNQQTLINENTAAISQDLSFFSTALLVIFLLLAALLGLISASWPARRAARLDVLAAITAQ
jgi:ABC-type lipoprotein release transport system permease subunit